MQNDIVSKFTNHLKNTLTRALTLVVEQGGEHIEPLHLFWSLAHQEGSVASEVMKKMSITTEDIGNFVSEQVIKQSPHTMIPTLSEQSKHLIEKAVLTANMYEHRYVGTEHLLFVMVQNVPSDLSKFFADKQNELRAMQMHLQTIFKTTSIFPEFSDMPALIPDAGAALKEEDDDKSSALDYFTDELTTRDAVAQFHPVIGREEEIDRLMHILARKTKNNPVLVGEPGVGKTAIVEGLAKRIVERDVPPVLEDKHIHRLDLASLIAGTMYRGEFESRLKQLIEEVEERPDVILFIDEVHSIAGAGAASGSLDAANMLKPALARGDIRCIGATTSAEFKRFIEADGALERRFQPIHVAEPTKEETLKILQGTQKHYAKFHGVSYTPEAIRAAVDLADRYLPTKFFPDKALDLIDEAAAKASIKRRKTDKRTRAKILDLEEKIAGLKKRKDAAAMKEQFDVALSLKEIETEFAQALADERARRIKSERITIDEDDIRRMVAQITHIPLEDVALDTARFARMKTALQKQVVGQDDAIQKVVLALERSRFGFNNIERPLASFFFVGPSGVGKTSLAQALAKQLFGKKEGLLRLDMSEFAERFSMSKLIGAPAGYVGYRDTNTLADHVKRYPHSVLLFDEIEKAHPEVVHLLLQMLDYGVLTDATGAQVNFRNTIVIFTSNVGSERFEGRALGFGNSLTADKTAMESEIRTQLTERFSREFLNRIGHVCFFHPLTPQALERIAQSQTLDLKKRLGERGIALTLFRSHAKYIAAKCNHAFGARDVERIIAEEIEHAILETLLNRPSKKSLSVKQKAGSVIVE